MNRYKRENQETERVIRYTCSALMACFVFCYLYFMQGEVLAQAQHAHSHGITHYSIIGGALVITVVAMLLQWVARRLVWVPLRFHALSYIPSAMMLAALVDVAESASTDALSRWAWIAPLGLVVYAVACHAARRIDELVSSDELEVSTLLYPNCIIMLALSLAVGGMSATRDVGYYELKAERLILQGDYDEALRVGDRALRTSPRLTQLRMYALSRQGCLAERLFHYPQRYASAGLLAVADTDSVHRVNAATVCRWLGARCGRNVRSGRRYLELLMGNDSLRSRRAADYYLCALLLDKSIELFASQLPQCYDLSDTIVGAYDSLPTAYKEALLMMSDEAHALTGAIVVGGDSLGALTDSALIIRYRDYLALKAGLSNERERVNKTHRQFGDTFWWYYDFSDKANGELVRK